MYIVHGVGSLEDVYYSPISRAFSCQSLLVFNRSRSKAKESVNKCLGCAPPPKSFEFLKYKFCVWMNCWNCSVFTRDSGNKVMMHDDFKFSLSSKLSKVLSLKSVKRALFNSAPFNLYLLFSSKNACRYCDAFPNKHLSF